MERDMKEKGFSVVRLRLVIFNCVFKEKKKKERKKKRLPFEALRSLIYPKARLFKPEYGP